eukprot:comp7815_c0_seq1/m.8067 comp7815_c0_seq1/g.8067  ORF comp7815_c0_seq1/g.8067 comp7815_c0_seq1/m.8067 type:complete len:213 (+) comp7815_c0_seq1:91-729(+)
MGESPATLRKLFDLFDVDRNGRIDVSELKIVLKGLGLYPPVSKIKEMIREVDKDGDGVINFREFCDMRKSDEAVELNVLAEFKKFDVDWLHRGFITRDSIFRVLEEEGYSHSAIEKFADDMMLCDTNGDGKVSYRDLYERMIGRIPDEWLDWIAENVARGVPDVTILQILVDNGFKPGVAQGLLHRTKREGRQPSENTYIDHAHYQVYTVRS